MKTKKEFDAVQMMRTIRDEISLQLKDKNFEEQQRYIQERISSFNVKNYGKFFTNGELGSLQGPSNEA